MRWWILVGCGVLVIAAAIWPFGRKTEQLGTVPMPPLVASKPAPAPKAEPAKIVEVIDLARAYEPVREPEEPAGTINPASFIQVPDGPRRIPPAMEWDAMPERIDVMPREVSGALGGLVKPLPTGGVTASGLFTVVTAPPVEALTAMPREVIPIGNGLLNFAPTTRASGHLVFTPMGVPFAVDIIQPIPPAALIEQAAPVESLKVIPREADVNQRMTQLLNESEELRQAREEFHRLWMNNQPSVLTYERLNGAIERTERLDVKPREVK